MRREHEARSVRFLWGIAAFGLAVPGGLCWWTFGWGGFVLNAMVVILGVLFLSMKLLPGKDTLREMFDEDE